MRTYGLPGPVLRWEQLRDQIHQDVVSHAFDAERNTFTQAYGSTALDASLLLIPRVGFLPATDPRVMGTIDAVRRELTDGGLVKRYQTTETHDGIKGSEGLFIACSFWLVDALHAAGPVRRVVEADRTGVPGSLVVSGHDATVGVPDAHVRIAADRALHGDHLIAADTGFAVGNGPRLRR